jgi:DNA-binding MurR/RpiR family transcriptional regulator
MTRHTVSAERPDLVERVRSSIPELSSSERRVAHTVLAAPRDVAGMSAARLAAASGTSVGTVVRFCHALGCAGFQDFKTRVAVDTAPERRRATPSDADGPAGAVLSRTLVDLARAVDSLDIASIERAAHLVSAGHRSLILASGPSQSIAMALGQWLSWAGHTTAYPTDPETQEAIAARLNPGDVCIAISHSGVTPNTIAPVRAAAARGARVVAVTSFPSATLAGIADAAIVAGAPADEHRTADMASRPVHLAVVHALTACIPPRPAAR